MIYTPETISDASERRQIPKMPSRGIVVVDANSYSTGEQAALVGDLSLITEVGVLVVGDETRPFNPRTNVQHVSRGQRSFSEIVREVQPDIVITGADYEKSTLVKSLPPIVDAIHEKTYVKRSKRFNARNTGVIKFRYNFSKNMTVAKGTKAHYEWTGLGYKVRVIRKSKRNGLVEVGNVVRDKLGMSPWHLITKRDEVIIPSIVREFEGTETTITKKIEQARLSGNYAHFAPIDARWNGTKHTDEPHEQLLGVRGVVERAMRESDKSVSNAEGDYPPTKSNKVRGYLAEYDVAVGSAGFYAGLIGALGGNVATEQRFAVKALTEAAAGLVVAATAVEATVRSERVRELVGKAKKFLSSVMVFGLGASVGLAVGGVLEMGSELVEAVGVEMVHENEWNVAEQESQPVQEEVFVPQPPTEAELAGESIVAQAPEPEMTWVGLTAHFEQQLTADGGVVWVNDQGTERTDDDVSQAQVMAHKALMAGGIDEAASALDAIAKTTSFDNYMQVRAAGDIYSGVGN